MVAIIDYDAGNLRSVEKALEALGAETVVTRDPEVIAGPYPGISLFWESVWGCSFFLRKVRRAREFQALAY